MPVLLDAAERRWSQLVEERPQLEPAIALQRTLLGHVIDTYERLSRARLPKLSLPPKYLAAKLTRGVPMLRNEPVPLPVSMLVPVIPLLCDALAEGGAGEAARHIRAVIDTRRLDAGSLLAALFARDQHAVRAAAAHLDLASDLLWLVGELAVSPFVHILGQTLLGGGEAVESALTAWTRGYCPLCGSWPALAELSRGTRALRCSFCATAWHPPEYHCIYCGNQDAFGPAAPDAERPDRLLELCRACAGYLKALVLDTPAEFPLVAIEDLATIDLDQAAMELGFVRPPLPAT